MVTPAAILAGLFVTAAALERIPALRFAPFRFLRPHLATDVAWYLVATGAGLVTTVLFRPQLSRLALPGVDRGLADLPIGARFVIALVVYDCVSTGIHVGMHRSEALWSIHKVHHSSLRLDWLATTRAHLLENLVRQVPAQAVLFMLGMPASMVATTLLVFAGFALFGHSNLRVGGRRIELVFVTPRLHRLHHIPATGMHNFGTVLTVWDRLLGRLMTRDATPDERVGVPGEIDDYPQRFVAALRQPIIEARARRRGLAAEHGEPLLLGAGREDVVEAAGGLHGG